MTNHLFLDTETLGLHLNGHDVWELAYAVDDGKIHSGFLRHDPAGADPEAMRINGYTERMNRAVESITVDFEENALAAFRAYRNAGNALVLVGANPSFDAYRLSRRWGGEEPWHYRMLDVGTYAMPLFNNEMPMGLNHVANALTGMGYAIPLPDHTAAGDVEVLRECFYALQGIYSANLKRTEIVHG